MSRSPKHARRSRHRKPIFGRPAGRLARFESLENRRLLAVTATFSPQGVLSFVGDGGADAVEIFVEGGLLKYTGAMPDAAVLNVSVNAITALVVDLGGGEDSVEFGGAVAIDVSNGRLSVSNVETTLVNQSIHTGGDQDYLGGRLVISLDTFTLSAGGGIMFGGAIDGAPPVPSPASAGAAAASGGDFLAWQRNFGRASGATRTQGDLDGDCDVDASDLNAFAGDFGVATQQPRAATAAGDGVDGGDFLAWQRSRGTTAGATRDQGDRDGDGDVDAADLAAVQASYGVPPFAAASHGGAHLIVTAAAGVEFRGAVGAVEPLGSLAVEADELRLRGAFNLNGNSTTFNSPVILTGDLTVTDAGDVTFNDTVDGDGNGPWALVIETPTNTTFNGAVGDGAPLASLETDAGGTTFLGGLRVTTVGNQTFNDAVTLTADVELTTNNVLFAEAITGNFALIVNTTGNGDTTFGDVVSVGSLSTNADGRTLLGAGAVTTTGNQTYSDPVTLTANAFLTGANVRFFGTVNGAFDLAINTAPAVGTTEFHAVVGGMTPLQILVTDNDGTTLINAPQITTTGDQIYGDAVTLVQDAIVQSTAGIVTFGAAVDAVAAGGQSLDVRSPFLSTFAGPVGAAMALRSLTTDALGSTRIGGLQVRTTGDQTYNDAVELTANATLAANDVTFASFVNGAFDLVVNTSGNGGTTFQAFTSVRSIVTNLDGRTVLSGMMVTTTGDQTYNDRVVLTASTTLDGANVRFFGTVDGAFMLNVVTDPGGETLFNQPVGDTMPLANVTTDANGRTTLGGLRVTTIGGQVYNDAVVLAQDMVLQSLGGNIRFESTVNGTTAGMELLDVRTSGLTIYNGVVGAVVSLESLTTDAPGETILTILPAPAAPAEFSVRTTGSQTYGDVVTLGQDTALTSLAGDVTFAAIVNGATAGMEFLEVRAPGTTTFNGVVGGVVTLERLVTDAPGLTRLNILPVPGVGMASVRTSGDQTYNNAVVLAQDTRLISLNGNVTFASTLNGTTPGTEFLVINAPESTTFGGVVGGIVPLDSLTTDGPGRTRFNILAGGVDVRTVNDQTYNDAVILLQDTILESAAGNVTFESTINGSTPGMELLLVRAPLLATFRGVVGGVTPLESLTTEGPGQTILDILPVPVLPNEFSIRTSGNQTYGDAVELQQDTVLVSLAGDVTFDDTVNGTTAGTELLDIRAPGMTVFNDVVGSLVELESLTTDVFGQTKLNIAPGGVDVLTRFDQTYNDAVVLMQDAIFESLLGDVTFANTIDGTAVGAQLLEVRSPEITTFGGVVGGVIPLESLTTDLGGETHFDIAAPSVDITTTGNQTYNDQVFVLDHASLESGLDVTFNLTVDGDGLGPWDLIVDADRFVFFEANVGAAERLRDLIVRTGGVLTGPLTIDMLVFVTRDIDMLARESVAASEDDDFTLAPTGRLTAGRHVFLRAGDDVDLVSGAVIDADGALTVDGDFGDNDAFATRINTTTGSPASTDATGMLRGGGGIVIHGGNDSNDVINLQADRLVTPGAVTVQGYLGPANESGNDQFLLVYSPNFAFLTVGSLTIDGGGDGEQDHLTIDHGKDTGDRKVAALYTTTAVPVGPLPVIDGENASFTGLGTTSGFNVLGMEKYLLKAGTGIHDFFLIQSRTDPALASATDLQQEIIVSNNASGQWQVLGWESGQLTGSNIRDVIFNNTSLPMLILGGAGNDTLVGGSSIDLIFSARAPFSRVGTPETIPSLFDPPLPPNPPVAPGAVIPGDVLVGGGGDDFLFADADLFRDGPLLWGLVTLDVPGEFDIIDGAGLGTVAIAQRNHAGQFGANDLVRNITGMLVDGGAVKDVLTWLTASPMPADLDPGNTSDALNMLIDGAFRANSPGIKVGILSPPYNAVLDDFAIPMRALPAAAVPAIMAPSAPAAKPAASLPTMTSAGAKSTSGTQDDISSVDEYDAAFSDWDAVLLAI